MRHDSLANRLLIQFDHALRTLTPGVTGNQRQSPAGELSESDLNEAERQHAAGLMRVNHSGEVCAQALYQGQALTAKLPEVRQQMQEAADEEIDHLAWCEERVQQLDQHTSVLNPIWYTLSFGLGAGAGLISDKLSLGFVAAIEDQVCHHLESHLQSLPEDDSKSRTIVEQMLIDEQHHSTQAIEAGGYRFPKPVKVAMTFASKAMTETSYRI